MNDHMPGNEPSTRLTLSAPRERLSVYVCTSFPFGFGGGTWDLIVLVPFHWKEGSVRLLGGLKIFVLYIVILLFIYDLFARRVARIGSLRLLAGVGANIKVVKIPQELAESEPKAYPKHQMER